MQTSKTKAGNPNRNSRAVLRKKRIEKEIDRAIDLGLPYGPAILFQCPHCDKEKSPTLIGHSRLGRAVLICTQCSGDVTGSKTYHNPPPQRKKKRERKDD